MKTIFFDTESNGYKDEQICQLAYVIREDGKHICRNHYFSVSSMNPHAFEIHGLSKFKLDELSSGKRFFDNYEAFFDDFKSADLLVGHNVASDIKRLQIEFSRHGIDFRPNKQLCTMKYFGNALKLSCKNGRKKQPSLVELCSYYRIVPDAIRHSCAVFFGEKNLNEHDARYDTIATYLCVLAATQSGDIKGVIE